MIWILIAACFLAVLFGIRLFRLKRQLRNVTGQLNERTNEKTEKVVTVALIDNDLSELAAAINRNLDLQKKLCIDVRRNDLQLKDSIANLSHDLRTPLTSILGYLQLCRSPDYPAEKRDRCLQIVDDKAHVLKTMINSLYELSVLDIKEAHLKKEKLDLNLLMTDTLAGQYELFQKHGIDLRITLPNYPVWVVVDRVACTRIIQNLLNNTVRYAKGRAEISLGKNRSSALLLICNPAPDLTQENMEHLFERFYTADKSRTNGGSGLGLYIVKKMLNQMEGNIDASLKDKTLSLEISLPLF
ncbi:MAG TPA: HAMP domain-containing sensor histidine kinase [Caproiciproducens sp.]|nr:HAMP domain-containing sensor histidine kinase [Caproiciproducens sp.]